MTANLSHYIDANGNKQAEIFAGSNLPPWHGEGVLIQGRATADEALELAHLNWKCSKQPLFVKNPAYIAGSTIPRGFEVKDQFAIMRDDRTDSSGILGIVSSDYKIINNCDQLNILDPIVGRNEACYESAGALGNGERVWLLVKLPDQLLINGKDVIDEYLMIASSHDGSLALTVKTTLTRIICGNTLRTALNDGRDQFKIRHTSNANEKMEQATRILGIARKQAEETGKAYNYLATKMFDTTILNYFLISVFPMMGENRTRTENTRQGIELLATKTGMGLDIAGKTLWGLYNAVTEWASKKTYKNGTSRMGALMFGSGDALIGKALKTALEIPELSDAEMLNAIKIDSEKGKQEPALIA
jgi:phage/plasmid-like protein (TIGR03299 family)